MRAEECAEEYTCLPVKQDLAKNDKDGENRVATSHALKQELEKLELGLTPRFLAQVSESLDTEGSHLHALALCEEVGRARGKLIIPLIGQVMSIVTRSLSFNGSSSEVHQACVEVATSWIRYCIDVDSSVLEAGEILKEVSQPLVDLLAVNSEHVVAGAATCLGAIVESEKWKHAPEDLVREVCNLSTTALGNNSTRTIAQIQLARSLLIMNPEPCREYGGRLLTVAQEVLNDCNYSLQLRTCATKMLQTVFETMDRTALGLTQNSKTQVLENSMRDSMSEVRAAPCEALQMAKWGDGSAKEQAGRDHRGLKHFDLKDNTPQQRNWNPNNYIPSSQDTYYLSSYTPPPASCDSALFESSSASHSDSTSWLKRSPYVPVPVPRLNDSLVGDKAPLGMQLNKEELALELELTPTVTQDHPKGKVESRFSPFEALITRSFCEADGDLMAEDEDILSGGSADLDGRMCGNNGMRSGGYSRWSMSMGKLRLDSQTRECMEDSVQSNAVSCIGMQSGDSDADSIAALSTKGCSSSNKNGKVVDLLENKQMPYMGSLQALKAVCPNACNLDNWISHAQYMKLENLSNSPEDGYSAMKPRVLITTADFMPYTTPRRLVLSLQSQLLSPGDEVTQEDGVWINKRAGEIIDINEDAVRRIEHGTIKRIDFIEEADMDVDSSSDSDCSVRDNPIASDESAMEKSTPQDIERHIEIHDGVALSREIQNVLRVTPKKSLSQPTLESEFYYTSQALQQESSEIDDVTPHLHISRPCGALAVAPAADEVCTSRPKSKLDRSAPKFEEGEMALDGDRSTDDRSNEQDVIISTSNCSQADESRADVPACEEAIWIDDVSAKSWSNTSLLHSAKRGCSKIMSIAELVLKGSLCVVVAVPISMALATVLQTPTDYYLVPT